ncbi:ABC-2 type transport system permease protein [Actinomadura coerulea]|uniref:Transport permease protein n=1 Tax=Actinomadura coerulea TaxID=46159 RepID=A0A7X0FVU9_9ACTN|nr:ABC transporter permease [Actinomadura coerulea]MBB6394656.1 ABC-2 type transport system permease protein [Actinomadura coerulea]GGQ36735.1 transport permease protein [Actinomadura coerulea]
MTTSQPMTRARGPLAAPGERPPRAGALSASMTFGWRALLKIKHSPNQLVDALMLPVIFTLSFTYLVGGAIAGSPGRYLHFFLPGVMVMAVALTTAYTGIVLNQDVDQGVFDRVRSLPVWQSSVLVGAMLGDVVRYAVASVVPLLLGLALGFRPDGGVGGVVLALLFLQLFAFCLAWIGTFVGVSVRTPTAAQTLSWTLLFILVVASNVMVPQQTMPGWLEGLIKVNPISVATTAMRGLMDGTATAGQMGWAFLACAVLVAVFAPLTMYRYGRGRH